MGTPVSPDLAQRSVFLPSACASHALFRAPPCTPFCAQRPHCVAGKLSVPRSPFQVNDCASIQLLNRPSRTTARSGGARLRVFVTFGSGRARCQRHGEHREKSAAAEQKHTHGENPEAQSHRRLAGTCHVTLPLMVCTVQGACPNDHIVGSTHSLR